MPLSGITVLDLGSDLAGQLLCKLLGDQGARVIRLQPGERAADDATAIWLTEQSERVRLDPLDPADRGALAELLPGVDVVVDTFRPGLLDEHQWSNQALERLNPRLVHCSLPAFGQLDPRREMPAWEGVVMAAAGAYAKGEGMFQADWWPDEEIAFSPLPLASVFAGAQGALGVAAALVARERDGAGQQVEVPLFDAFHEAVGARAMTYERNAPSGNLLASGLYRCADGRFLSFVTTWHRHLEWFLRAVDHDDWLVDAGGFDGLMGSADVRDRLKGRLAELFLTKDADEWEQLAREVGTPAAVIRTLDEWVAAGPFDIVPTPAEVMARPAVRVTAVGGGRVPAPSSYPRPVSSEPPLAGTRVVDLTLVLAAPTVARILGDLGAEVVRVDGDPGRSGLRLPILHESANRGKTCVALDLTVPTQRRQFEELCRDADVFVTNLTGAAVDKLRIGPDDLRHCAPDLVHATVNAFGATSPARDVRGFAEIANAVTGVAARTFDPDAPTRSSINVDLPRTPFTDYAAGIVGAFGVVVALLRRLRDGSGVEVETTLVDAAALMQLPFMAAASAGNPENPWHRLGWSALHRAYRASDGWVFVGLDDAAARELGLGPDPARTESQCEKRFAAGTVASAVDVVRRAGGAAHRVVAIDDLMQEGGTSDRLGLRLVHESREFGAVVQPGPAIRFARTATDPGGLPRKSDDPRWTHRSEIA